MATGVSLQVGVNHLNAEHYQFTGRLDGCVRDAEEMADLSRRRGFDVLPPLRDSEATADAVRNAIILASQRVGKDGVFLLSISCHGGQVPSTEQPNDEENDEICALFDRMLLDDELAALWTRFDAGARIVMFNDSCHSGSLSRGFPLNAAANNRRRAPARSRRRVRALPPDLPALIFSRFRPRYEKIQQDAADEMKARPLRATVLTLTACQDSEEANDSRDGGLFTRKVLAALASAPDIDYDTLHAKVAGLVTLEEPLQHPGITVLPKTDTSLRRSRIFKI